MNEPFGTALPDRIEHPGEKAREHRARSAVRNEREMPLLAALWAALVEGTHEVERTLYSSDAYSLLAKPKRRPASLRTRASEPCARDLEILEAWLLGVSRKTIATNFAITQSHISERLKRCFSSMGLGCSASHTPLLLVLAARARRAEVSPPASGPRRGRARSLTRFEVSIPRPEVALEGSLSKSQYALVRALLEGKSYAQMAEQRGTSARTVANQLAAAFARLGLSSRAELMGRLAERKLLEWHTAVARPSVSVSRSVIF